MTRGHYIKQLLEAIQYYRLADRHPDQIEPIVLMAEQGILTDNMAKAELFRIQPLIEKQKRIWNTLPKSPDQDELGEFDLPVGELIERPGVTAGIRILDQPRHILVSGATGSGKSSFLRWLIMALSTLFAQLGKLAIILVLDLKGDFVDIPDRLGRKRWRHFSVHDGFRIGLNPPVGFRNQTSWINQITRIIAAHCGLIFSASSLAAILRFALPHLNNPPTNIWNWPRLALVLDILRRSPYDLFATRRQYKDALEQRLEYVVENSGSLFDTAHGFDVVEDLIVPGRCAVIDMTTLSPTLVHIVVDIICSQILFWRMYERVTEGPLFCLVIDEADTLCSYRTAALYPEHYTSLGETTKKGRQFKIVTVLAMTYTGDCSQFITSNTTYHVSYNQSDPASAQEASRIHNLGDGSRLLGSFQPGECIFKESQGSCSYPMLIRTHFEEPSQMRRPEAFDRSLWVPGKGLLDPEMKPLANALNKHIAEHKATKKRQFPQEQSGPSDLALKLLELWYEDHLNFVVRLFEKMGNVSFSAQKRIVAALEELQLAVFEDLRLGSRTFRIMELLLKAFELLGKDPIQIGGRGKLRHRFMANRIKRSAEMQGKTAHLELIIQGTTHPVDVAVEEGRQLLLYEIIDACTGNIGEGIKSSFTNPELIRSLTIVVTQKSICKKLKAQVAAEMPLFPHFDRVKFETFANYL